ncbi:MAG: AI-2E family transporter, partial [Ignavibacteriae bacterium]|nr:AI-2E family transporter [Ignavibacteriota bacterium]
MNDIRNNRIVTVAAAFIIVALSFIVLKELQAILLPFFVAIIISFLFEPFYEWMKRKRVPSFAAIIVVVITIIILSNIISVFVYTSINSFRDEIPKYTQKSVLLVDNFVNYLVSIGVSSQSLKENLDVTKIFTGEKFATMLT